jgi:integrase
MAVRKRKDIGKWEVSLSLGGKRIRRTSPVQTKRGAQAYEIKLRQEYVDSLTSKQPSKKQASIEEFAVEWLKTYVAVNKRRSSLDGDERILRLHVLPFFAGKNLDEISTLDVEKFKAAQLKKGLKGKTINNHLAVLMKMLKTAEEWEYQAQSPSVKWFRGGNESMDFFTAEESTRLLSQLNGQIHTMVLTALRTGMRRGELLALKWTCVDFLHSTIRVESSSWGGIIGPTKTGQTRVVPMSNELARVLERYRRHSPQSEFVFCNQDGSKLKFTQIKRPVYAACKAADLREVQWHTFRHSFASQLVMAGVSLRVVQELLGHKSFEMTLVYSHLAPSTLSDAVEKLTEVGDKAKAAPSLKVIEGTA